MRYASLSDLIADGRALARGPVSLIFVEDEVEADGTLRHHLDCGFRSVIAFAGDRVAIAPEIEARVHRVRWAPSVGASHVAPVNAVINAAPGLWLHYGFNAEYLFYPFHGSRTVGELTTFVEEERREAVLTYVVDLYAADLSAHPNGVDVASAHLDRSGYYALGRPDGAGGFLDRQLDFHGGLRWRFEEHVAPARRRIDRIALFRAKKGLRLLEGHMMNDAEYNTYACPWHHNPTAALVSFRMAKALKTNPGSTHEIGNFAWAGSVPFRWEAQQLLDLGLMEPGQWF